MTVILVDNNLNNLSRLSDELGNIFPGCQIKSFADPLLSAKYICNNKVDLAFLAVEMRPVDGFDLMRTLRTNKPELPVIIVSGSEEHRETALAEEANAYLVKPISSELLKETIRQVLY